MAVTARIEFDSVAGNVNDYYSELGNTITLSNVDDRGVSVWAWTLQAPPGSVAFLSSATAQSPTFVADKVGSYLVSLTVNGGSATDSKIYSILADNTLIRIPAEGEIDESGSDGWSTEVDQPLMLTGFAGCRGACIIAVNNTGVTLSRGDVVAALATDATTKQFSIAAKATPAYIADTGTVAVYLVVSAIDGGATTADGDQLILLQDGVLSGLSISGTIGDDGSYNVSLGETAGELEHGTFCVIGYALAQDAIFFSPRLVSFGKGRIEGGDSEYPTATTTTTERKRLGEYVHFDLNGGDHGLKLPVVGADDLGTKITVVAEGSEDYILSIVPYHNTDVVTNLATGVSTGFVTLLKSGLHDEFKSAMAPGWSVSVSGQDRTVLTIEESDAAGAAGTTHWKVTPSAVFSPAPTITDPVVLQSFSIVGNNTTTRDDAHIIRGGDSVTFMLWGESASGTTRKWIAIARDQQNYDDEVTYFDKISAVKAHSLAYNQVISRPDLSLAATYELRRSDLASLVILDVTSGNKHIDLPPVRMGELNNMEDEGKSIICKVIGTAGTYASIHTYQKEVTCVTVDASGWFTCLKSEMNHPDITDENEIGVGWLAYFVAASDMYHVGLPFESCDATGGAGSTHWKITMDDHSWGYGSTPVPGQKFNIYNMYMESSAADLGVKLMAGPVGTGFGESATFTVSWKPLTPWMWHEDSLWITTDVSRIANVFDIASSPIGSYTPQFIGQTYLDTSTGLLYVANGLTNTDWNLV